MHHPSFLLQFNFVSPTWLSNHHVLINIIKSLAELSPSLSLFVKSTMSDQNPDTQTPEQPSRHVGGTEYSWCKAVPGGTGVTVLALLFTKPPNIPLLQSSLHNLQIAHPILRSKLRLDASTATATFSFLIPPTPHLQLQLFDLSSTSRVLQNLETELDQSSLSPFHLILEHEINRNAWCNPDDQWRIDGHDVFFASVYTISETQWVAALRIHTAACDRTAAVAAVAELLELVGRGEERRREFGDGEEVSLGIEEMIPSGKANKPFWARGMDMLGYSLNSLRLSNLKMVDVNSPRCSKVVRLQLNPEETERLLAGCRARGIKLCGALAAAGLIAAYSSKHLPENQWEKYAVATLIDCRSILFPVLSSNHSGFYHSAILNTHDIGGGEELWELAKRCYTAFANAKNSNKHFSDMGDLNFLMCKAIDNPHLTPSSSLRTSLISVFEESVIDVTSTLHAEIGVEDWIGCASIHGVGPSIAVFDTIRDGQLDCAYVYPSPLHSREQMEHLADDMRRILVDGSNNVEIEN